MQFFGIVSMILMILSAAMFIPVLVIYVQTGLVPNFPTLIVSGFVALAALESLFAGMILSTLAERERQEFEFRLQLVRKMKKDEL